MKLRQIFGVNESKIDFKSPFSILIGFITPHLILIAFILLVGRLILNENSGIFSNGLLVNSILEIVSYLIMTASLVYLQLDCSLLIDFSKKSISTIANSGSASIRVFGRFLWFCYICFSVNG